MFCFLFAGFAQKGGKDKVYLKSGSVVKGEIITSDAEVVKINSAGNSWVYNVSEVDSIYRHENAKMKSNSDHSLNYFFDTTLGVLIGNSANNQDAPFSFMTSVNFKTIDKLYLGAGLGAEFLQESYLPVFGQVKYQLRETRFTPFINFQAGYLVPLEDATQFNYYPTYLSYSSYYPYPQNNEKLNSDGGFFFNPSVGFQVHSTENFGWFFSFGYRHHQLNYSGKDNYSIDSNFSRLSLKIGFIFN
jgi:hypothetical protein